jgi:hypothetical protein
LIEVSAEVMPRLHHALHPALLALGAQGQLWLHPSGGVEAFLTPGGLVVGVGALAQFGTSELIYLSALALALGPEGQRLARPGPVEALQPAACEAFLAYPSSLGAARVLATLDPRVRGAEPTSAGIELLPTNAAFREVALCALARIER